MKRSVILISDNEEIYELMRFACRIHNLKVVGALEGYEGVVIARDLVPLAIFIDATGTLSHNGWINARLIKSDLQLRNTPIVLFSNAEDAARQAALLKCHHLNHPPHLRTLSSYIRQIARPSR
jgi:DNA-binding response OmpR family regulator